MTTLTAVLPRALERVSGRASWLAASCPERVGSAGWSTTPGTHRSAPPGARSPLDERPLRRCPAPPRLAIAGFTALGSIFDHPRILEAPTGEILARYREHHNAISAWFLALIVGAALPAPMSIAFTVLVVVSSSRTTVTTRWISSLGYAAAVLIATGVLVPLGFSGAAVTNFVGCIAWCGWLVTMAVVLWRSTVVTPTAGRGSVQQA